MRSHWEEYVVDVGRIGITFNGLTRLPTCLVVVFHQNDENVFYMGLRIGTRHKR